MNMKAIFSKDQYSPVMVVNTNTKERLFNALVLFPGVDPSALVAMKVYIDTLADDSEILRSEINELKKEYERLKLMRDKTKEFEAWQD